MNKHPAIGTAGMWKVKDVAKELGLHTHTIYRLVESGELPGVKIGKSYRFKPEIVDAWFKYETDRQREARIIRQLAKAHAPPSELKMFYARKNNA